MADRVSADYKKLAESARKASAFLADYAEDGCPAPGNVDVERAKILAALDELAALARRVEEAERRTFSRYELGLLIDGVAAMVDGTHRVAAPLLRRLQALYAAAGAPITEGDDQ